MIEVRGQLAARPADVWDILTDSAAWPRWGPSVRAVDSPTRFIGPGTTGRVQTAIGIWLPFRVDDWKPGRYWHWRIAGMPATGHAVLPVGQTSCEVVFSIPAWAPFYRPVCAAAIRRIGVLAASGTAQGSG